MNKILFENQVRFELCPQLADVGCRPEFDECGNLHYVRLPIMPRACFFDLDGTVIGVSGKLSPSVTQALQKVQALGIRTSIATGRPYFAAKEIIRSFGPVGPSMFFSGALVIDPSSENVIAACELPHEELNPLVDFARSKGWYTELYDLNDYYVEEDSIFAEMHFHYLQKYPHKGVLNRLAEERAILKAGFIVPIEISQEVQRAMESEFPHLAFTSARGAAHTDIMFINATSKNASRESAFVHLTESLGVSSQEIFAFGDGEADQTFLRLAGCGIAMSDGNSLAIQAADILALPVEEDGVALVLNALSELLVSS